MTAPDTRFPDERPSVVAIGNFDGVHLGHRAVLSAARDEADRRGWSVGALTFEPHPQTLFRQRPPAEFRLQGAEQRHAALLRAGADWVVTAAFTPEYAAMSAEAFVRDELVGRLRARQVRVGSDYRFGNGRVGDVALLRELMAAAGGEVIEVPEVTSDGERVSSSRLRALLAAGELRAYARLAGELWSLEGPVSSGAGRGRQIGVPTLNLYPGEQLLPPFGVYATRVHVGASIWPGVTNLGRRPTFPGDPRVSCETHVLTTGLHGLGPGTVLDVEFVEFIRGERRFESIDALVAQIAADAGTARSILGM